MEVPKNCAECQYTYRCPAPHYGGRKCIYHTEINKSKED